MYVYCVFSSYLSQLSPSRFPNPLSPNLMYYFNHYVFITLWVKLMLTIYLCFVQPLGQGKATSSHSSEKQWLHQHPSSANSSYAGNEAFGVPIQSMMMSKLVDLVQTLETSNIYNHYPWLRDYPRRGSR